MTYIKLFRTLITLAAVFLTACSTVVMHPSGYIAAQQSQLILIATVLMLLIIVPVIALVIVFAWRYRQGNTSATYEPEWSHSTQLELVIWSAPLLIIIALGAVTWISTHTLDPYRPLQRIDAQRAVPEGVKPLVVDVVALDWKWLFIYPDLGIASVNELAAPVDVPITFRITASSVMNSFFIPALAGQIYAMPGMQTQLHAVINETGVFDGFSANYSGAGFSGMRFQFHGLRQADFDAWVQGVKSDGRELGRERYVELAKPSEQDPVQHFAPVTPGLYDSIVNRCVEAGQICLSAMMASAAEQAAAAQCSTNDRPDAAKQLSVARQSTQP